MLWIENSDFAKNLQTQYMLGDDLLIAPVIRRNQDTRGLYVPEVSFLHKSTPRFPTVLSMLVPTGAKLTHLDLREEIARG